jgi:hypothetical protein
MDAARIAILLPNNMAARNILESPVLSALAGESDLEVVFITSTASDAKCLPADSKAKMSWADIGNPNGSPRPGLFHGPSIVVFKRLLHRVLMRLVRPWCGFGNLVFRFNEIHQFAGHKLKKRMPKERQEREAQAGNFVVQALGRPLPRSRALFRLLFKIYHSSWYSEPPVEAFFDRFEPHLLVVYHLQFEADRPYGVAARRRGIPILGVIGSWDQPTTKGPLLPGANCYLVQNQRMRKELGRYHGVPREKVEVTGWMQMDPYADGGLIIERKEFLASLGLGPDHRYILFGGNGERLGHHEPSIAGHIKQQLIENRYGPDTTLLIRAHPIDNEWQRRFGALHEPPQVIVMAPERGRLDFLANLLHHAGAVLASSGSILLDAIAMDTPAVGIAFDGDLQVDYDLSIARFYEMDHYAPVVEGGGATLARDFNELDELLAQSLDHPELGKEGRWRVRAEQLEPLDGKAAQRTVELIKREAMQSRGQGSYQ